MNKLIALITVTLLCGQVDFTFAALSESDLIRASEMGVDLIEKLQRHESAIANSPIKVHNGSVSHGLLLENYPTSFSIQQNYFANMILKGTEYLLNNNCKRIGFVASECLSLISDEIPDGTNLRKYCEMGAKSQKHSKRGVHIYRRLVKNNYKDGIYKIPHSVNGGDLPNPRMIAEKLYLQSSMNSQEKIDQTHSIAVAQWAQFIEQDLARTVQSTMKDGTPIECCNKFNRVAAPRSIHPSCNPIRVSNSDEYYSKIDVSCLNYVRSAIAVNPTCKFGPAQQLNQASNHLDLSQLYGITEDERYKIRKFSGGKLKSQTNASFENLPIVEENCISGRCFSSGDPRVNSNPYSYVLHTLFLRFHNHLAHSIAHVNPFWTDEEVFQAAKTTNIHVYQKIIYEEWAPVVIGIDKAREIRHSHNNQDTEREMVSNEFATVIRFYNTMFPGDLMSVETKVFENNIRNVAELDPFVEQLFALDDVQFKPKKLSLEKIMAAVTRYNAFAFDTSYVDDLSNQLYKSTQYQQAETKTFGTDSLALDIQRSRDHGLPGYTKYIKFCSGRTIHSWEDLNGLIDPQDLEVFRKVYKSFEDIDLIVGALAEITQQDATVGPTLQCIIADQLKNSKVNDHNFYSTQSNVAQRHLQHSAARLLCEMTKMMRVQDNIFLVPSPENSLKKCSDLDNFELISGFI